MGLFSPNRFLCSLFIELPLFATASASILWISISFMSKICSSSAYFFSSSSMSEIFWSEFDVWYSEDSSSSLRMSLTLSRPISFYYRFLASSASALIRRRSSLCIFAALWAWFCASKSQNFALSSSLRTLRFSSWRFSGLVKRPSMRSNFLEIGFLRVPGVQLKSSSLSLFSYRARIFDLFSSVKWRTCWALSGAGASTASIWPLEWLPRLGYFWCEV